MARGHRSGPERWSSIAILVCGCDLVLTYLAGSRFSLGWYAGRSLTMVAGGIVLIAMRRRSGASRRRPSTTPATTP